MPSVGKSLLSSMNNPSSAILSGCQIDTPGNWPMRWIWSTWSQPTIYLWFLLILLKCSVEILFYFLKWRLFELKLQFISIMVPLVLSDNRFCWLSPSLTHAKIDAVADKFFSVIFLYFESDLGQFRSLTLERIFLKWLSILFQTNS